MYPSSTSALLISAISGKLELTSNFGGKLNSYYNKDKSIWGCAMGMNKKPHKMAVLANIDKMVKIEYN